jgi:hypothetical protein
MVNSRSSTGAGGTGGTNGTVDINNVVTVASDPPWNDKNVGLKTLLAHPHHAGLYVATKTLPRWILECGVIAAVYLMNGVEAVLVASLKAAGVPEPETRLEMLQTLVHTNNNFALSTQTPDGIKGVVDEIYLERSYWGYDLDDLKLFEGVYKIMHSPGDKLVPVSSAHYISKSVNNHHCNLILLPPYNYCFKEGHMIMIEHWKDIIDGKIVGDSYPC